METSIRNNPRRKRKMEPAQLRQNSPKELLHPRRNASNERDRLTLKWKPLNTPSPLCPPLFTIVVNPWSSFTTFTFLSNSYKHWYTNIVSVSYQYVVDTCWRSIQSLFLDNKKFWYVFNMSATQCQHAMDTWPLFSLTTPYPFISFSLIAYLLSLIDSHGYSLFKTFHLLIFI